MRNTNYKQFSFLVTNRVVVPEKVNRFKTIFEDIGFLEELPILVTPELKIIDGQHRFRACEQLGLPIVYKVYNGDCSPEKLMVLLNMNQSSWSMENYIHTWNVQGKQFYKELVTFENKYKFSFGNSLKICGVLDIKIRGVKKGFEPELRETRYDIAEFICGCNSLSFHKKTHFIAAVVLMFRKTNHNQRERVKRNQLLIKEQAGVNQYLTIFENIINRGATTKVSL